MAVTAYLKRKQLLPFGFAQQNNKMVFLCGGFYSEFNEFGRNTMSQCRKFAETAVDKTDLIK